jgi:competence protein ComEC
VPGRLAVFASSWLAGTIAAVWLVPVGHAAVAVAAIVLTAMIAARYACRSWPLVMAAAVVWTSSQLDFAGSRRLKPTLVGQDLSVSGWVDGFPSESDGQIAFSFRTMRDRDHVDLPARLRLTWYDPPLEVRAAMALELTVRLKRPRGLANPGGFDYERWLFAEKIGATGYVRSGGLAPAHEWTLPRRWLEFRASLASRIAVLAPTADARALLVALAVGERFGFERAHWRVLRETGTSHLVAISGLHIGIIAMWLFLLTRRIWIRIPFSLAVYDLEVASAVSLLGAGIYAAIAGFSVPTQRALIMLCVALALVVMRRGSASAGGMAIALVVVTAFDPLAVLSGGFWLSFGAVAVLSALVRPLHARRSRLAALGIRVKEAVRAQWGITIGLAPIIAVTFGQLSLTAPLVNLVTIPVFALLLVPLVLIATFCLVLGLPAGWLVQIAGACADGVFAALEWSSRVQFATVALPELRPVASLLMIAGTAIALPVQPLPGRFLGWIAIASALLYPPARPVAGAIRAYVLDVGHGLAVIVSTADHALLYDTGARYRSGFDMGRDVVLPAMRHLGVSRLDRIVVSHADNDHSGGLGAILSAYPSSELLASRDLAASRATDCVAGQQWQWDGVRFDVLHPPIDASLDGNDGSCVIRIVTAGGTMLLTGDIELRAERGLLSTAANVAANVVVVPHHGSATSSSAPFVEAVGARFAIVSAAFENRWGLPRPEVEQRWLRSGAQIITTGEHGAIEVLLGAGPVDVHAARWRWRRPWMATS